MTDATHPVITCLCGAPMRERLGKYGRFWSCSTYPTCTVTIGAHQATGDPMGTPGDDATRKARIAAHSAFDELWRGKSSRFRGRRSAAYQWLARAMSLPGRECHIANFDAVQCWRVAELCTALEAEYDGLEDPTPLREHRA